MKDRKGTTASPGPSKSGQSSKDRLSGLATAKVLPITEGMWWLILIPIAIFIGVVLYQCKDWVTIRRKNCCGGGCGCLFPKKKS